MPGTEHAHARQHNGVTAPPPPEALNGISSLSFTTCTRARLRAFLSFFFHSNHQSTGCFSQAKHDIMNIIHTRIYLVCTSIRYEYIILEQFIMSSLFTISMRFCGFIVYDGTTYVQLTASRYHTYHMGYYNIYY